MSFQRGFKSRANRIALDIRDKLGLDSTDPIDPEEVCKLFEIELIKLSSYDLGVQSLINGKLGSFSAMIIPCGLQTAIVHNDNHHPYRRRSNICHELAHCFLGHKHTPLLTEEGERVHHGSIEAEANFLGGCLLVPNEAAIFIVKTGLISSAKEVYGVSQSMLEYRLRMSGAYVIQQRKLAQSV